ncbi:hypothetical protein GCM10009798_20450 [Nocardioides panacihumi]|uniref:Secreted protein n=1 Tax=Nocardioides panacihumi TaxID=400774 RepID=A0ABN2QZ17_9ACTN
MYVLSIVMLLANRGIPAIYPRHAAPQCRDAHAAEAYGDRKQARTSRCGNDRPPVGRNRLRIGSEIVRLGTRTVLFRTRNV